MALRVRLLSTFLLRFNKRTILWARSDMAVGNVLVGSWSLFLPAGMQYAPLCIWYRQNDRLIHTLKWKEWDNYVFHVWTLVTVQPHDVHCRPKFLNLYIHGSIAKFEEFCIAAQTACTHAVGFLLLILVIGYASRWFWVLNIDKTLPKPHIITLCFMHWPQNQKRRLAGFISEGIWTLCSCYF